MIKKTFRQASAIVAVLALTASLAACSGSSSSTSSTSYSEEVRTNFVSACAAEPGATEAMCERCFAEVENEYTFDEFLELETAIRMGTASREDTDKLASILGNCV